MSRHMSIHMSIHMHMHMSIHMLHTCPCTCLYTCLYTWLYTRLHTCLYCLCTFPLHLFSRKADRRISTHMSHTRVYTIVLHACLHTCLYTCLHTRPHSVQLHKWLEERPRHTPPSLDGHVLQVPVFFSWPSGGEGTLPPHRDQPTGRLPLSPCRFWSGEPYRRRCPG